MLQGFSKENQTRSGSAYRFGSFELQPAERRLSRNGREIRLQPRAFDALLFLVRQAQHLVSKQEIMAKLWPATHVSEANLTNLIGDLRKTIGRNAIRTVSKHGYRFELPVLGEPGVRSSAYEKYLRAKDLVAQRSLEAMYTARDLYWITLAEEPEFASAWAWLGRCCWFINKFGSSSPEMDELARVSFERAFALDADLAVAHQFYTFLEVDTGRAAQAMHRLLKRLHHHPSEPETFAGLVQVFRFRGLLERSIEAHRIGIDLDPKLRTSVAHSYFQTGNYSAAIEAYSAGGGGYYLDAAAWEALGEKKRAIELLHERLGGMSLSVLMSTLLGSLLAILEDKPDRALRLMESVDTRNEPEIRVYFARHYVRVGDAPGAIRCLEHAAQNGFVCSQVTMRTDPWLSALSRQRSFKAFIAKAEVMADSAERTVRSEFPRGMAGSIAKTARN
jgi:DNA-binding winged helix-turn-helix (wHTH) protein